MKTLYIIGNGFDLYHGLPSRYADFHRYILETDKELLADLDNYFDFSLDARYLWMNFEQDLCKFDHKGFMDTYDHIDVMSKSFKPSEFYGLEDEVTEESGDLVDRIRQAFVSWVESFNFPETACSDYLPLPLKMDSRFLNFNYTDTLEDLYQIPKQQILYIHNNANADHDELIFGHGQKTDHASAPTFDEDGEPTRTMYTDAENASRSLFFAFQKDTKAVLKEHRIWFSALNNEVDEIIVLGHSLGKVDWPYFRKIAKQATKAKWTVSYYGERELAELQKRAVAMLRRKDVQMIKLQDL